jgi:hypothetical protein
MLVDVVHGCERRGRRGGHACWSACGGPHVHCSRLDPPAERREQESE